VHRREFEGARRADDEDDCENDFPRQPTARASKCQGGSSGGMHDLTDDDDRPPVVAVSDMADHEHRHDDWQELHQSQETEIKRAVRQGVKLPPDCDHLHLVGGSREYARPPEEGEGAMVQQSEG
jgi:hypothetical protein